MKKSEETRMNILRKAFELIYAKGYQTTSIDDIIATTQVTKGAFFYHFKNKDEMGIAIINDLLKPTLNNSFVEPLKNETNPLTGIYKLMHQLLIGNKFMKPEYGCPAGNLTQEMSGWNEKFNEVLNALVKQWQHTIITAIETGKKNGSVRNDVQAKQVTVFILSGYWGIRNLGKLGNSRSLYASYLKELKNYLASLE